MQEVLSALEQEELEGLSILELGEMRPLLSPLPLAKPRPLPGVRKCSGSGTVQAGVWAPPVCRCWGDR